MKRTIIILLILAGVSLNAIVGDNGMITNAMSAKQKSGIAILEEFLQEEYVGNYEKIENNDNKVSGLIEVHPNYFYVPASNGYGNLEYIEYDGKALYLINKLGLPQDIQEQLVGGDAGNKEYVDYLGLNDVYGVTKGLKVYYCSNGIDSIENLAKEDLDKAEDKPLFEAGEGSAGLGKLLKNYDSNNNGKVDSSEVSSIKELEIRETTDLTGIYNLYGLEKITIIDVPEINLEGIQNCLKLSTVWLYNSKAPSYEPIGKLKDRLVRLYISHGDDTQIEKLCTDIGKYDLTSLEYLGFFGGGSYYGYGPENFLGLTERAFSITERNNLNSLSALNNLSETTKSEVKYFYAPGNSLTDLVGINTLNGLTLLSVPYNSIASLSGIEETNSSIKYLQVQNNLMADGESTDNVSDSLSKITNLPDLYWLDISKNTGIKNISYLSKLGKLKYLYMDGVTSLENVGELRDFIGSLTESTYDSQYSKDLFDKDAKELSYSGQTLSFDDFKSIGNCVNLTKLDLSNVRVQKSVDETIEDGENTVEEIMDEVFSRLTKLQILGINNLQFSFRGDDSFEKVKSLSFLKLEDSNNEKLGLKNTLLRLDLRNTEIVAKGNINVTESSLSEIDNELSKKNTDILSQLLSLKNIILSTDKFDFVELQTMLNVLSNTRYDAFGGIPKCGGLVCSDEKSLKTLENCTDLSKFYCLSSSGNVLSSDHIKLNLDLSKLNKLKNIEILWVSGELKIPCVLDRLTIWSCASLNLSIDEEVNERGRINNLNLREVGSSKELDVFVNSNLSCHELFIENLKFQLDCKELLEEDGSCDWLDKLVVSIANWVFGPNDKLLFCESMSILKNSSIKEIDMTVTGEESLDFLKYLTQLENVTMRSRAFISGISALEPVYNDGNLVSGCPNLKTLNLSNNKIADISILGDLTNLESINFSNNIISSGIESLSKLENLTYINLSNNNLTTNTNYVTDLVSKNANDEFINIFKKLHETVKTGTNSDDTPIDIYLKDLDLSGTGIKGIQSRLNESGSKPWTTLKCDG